MHSTGKWRDSDILKKKKRLSTNGSRWRIGSNRSRQRAGTLSRLVRERHITTLGSGKRLTRSMDYGSLVLFLGFCIWTSISRPVIGDAKVSCVFLKTCVLPCIFRGGANLVIHWLPLPAKHAPVHSYYQDQDQLTDQIPHFKGRTSLFSDQVSRGNASLQIRKVEVEDEGRYMCYTSTNSGKKESVINLKVDAPVDKVDIEQVENRIFCSSEGIYPEPKLSWSISPPSTVTEQNKPMILLNEHQLYNISSSVTFTVIATDVNFSCNISTRTNWRTATLKQLSFLNVSSSETTIPCTSSNTSMKDFDLVWRFNYSQIILNQTRANNNYTTSQNWRQKVKEVSASGSLTLKDLSPDQDGIYTCELTNNKETYKSSTHLTITEGSQTKVPVGVVVGVLVVVGVSVVIGLRQYNRNIKDCYRNT